MTVQGSKNDILLCIRRPSKEKAFGKLDPPI